MADEAPRILLNTSGAGEGRRILNESGNVNPNSTSGAGRGYAPVKLGSLALTEKKRWNRTEVTFKRFKPEVFGGGGVTEGAFYTMRTVSGATDPDDDGDIYLQGGLVSGGTGNVVIPDILLFDASSGDDGAWVGTDGQTLIITVTGTGQETSGILDPVYNVNTPDGAIATIGAIGPNSLPEVGDLSGKICYLFLGSYFEGGFSPSGPGNFNIGFCWGNYAISRS
jgi:hypothetical protein